MLLDRRLLIEQEMVKLSATCAAQYFDVVVRSNQAMIELYTQNVKRLSDFRSDLIEINKLLTQGDPDLK